MKIPILLQAALFAVSSSGLAFEAPVATAGFGCGHDAPLRKFKAMNVDAPHPLPTVSPNIAHAELLKRDYELTVLIAPDNICGYASGLSTSSYFCNTGYTCDLILSAYTQNNSPVGAVACCNTASCGFRTTCIDAAAYSAGSRCSQNCALCTGTASPYCNGATFPALGVRDYFCDTTTTNVFQEVTTTYSNELVNRIYKTTSVLITAATTTASSASQSSSASASSTSATASTTNTPSTSATTTAASGGGSSGPPIGAIVGGVVGGVAFLAIVGLIVFFVMRKKRKARQAAEQPTPMQPPMTEYPPQGAGGPGPVAGGVGGAGAGAAWGYGQDKNTPTSPAYYEVAGSTPMAGGYGAAPPVHEAPGSMGPAPAGSPHSGYGSPHSGYANTGTMGPPIGPGSPGSPPPPSQLAGNDVYPHHNTIHEM